MGLSVMCLNLLFFVLKIETNATCFDETPLKNLVSEGISALCVGRAMMELVQDECDAQDERSRK